MLCYIIVAFTKRKEVHLTEFLSLLRLSVSGVNAIPTFFMILVLIYWITVILGIFQVDGFEIDVDVEADGFATDLLVFLKIGDIPVSIYCTILFTLFWVFTIIISILTNSWGGIPNGIGMIPSFVVAALITRITTIPLKKILNGINGNEALSKQIIGSTGTLKFDLSEGEMSQVIIDKGSFLVNCMGKEGMKLPAGALVKVLSKIEEENVYIIEPFRGELE